MSVQIGVVGAGAIAEQHVTALLGAGAELTAVADPDPVRAGGLIQEAATYRNADDLFAHPGLDAVVIASPNDMHAPQTIAALRAGLHVLCEIPVGMSLKEAQAVAAASKIASRHVAVAHTLRFCQPYRAVRGLVDSGELTVRHVVARTLMHRQRNVGLEGRTRTWTDDVRWHHGAHTVDAALWLLAAEVAAVSGGAGPAWPGSGRTMDAGLVLTTPSGGIATIALSYHARLPARELTIIAEDTTLRIDGGQLLSPDGIVVDCGNTAKMERLGLIRQDEEFVAAVAGGRQPTCTVNDVLPTMRALEQL
ncbi:Gfo/Idh/MocA family oxidoreductase [Phytoactinopolyspora alkaliphila]|uniref:Gfo/Idh/MocA family oxidoreductase n=1 Tax=Phytoactinopolyspora alkaliphila TaxID=1783498 RepID=A0A6N9YS50_9ACTN|nr:Gfo/Idh/MocA family oxidoreductase [Phytoactinopolyspora alkaliphila]